MQDTPTVVTDDEKTIERAEVDRRNSEEVHRGNRFTVITEKGKPAPGWLRISRRPFHPTRDRSLRDIKAEHENLAMDAWPPGLGDQPPVQTESGPVPTHDGFGRDHNEGLLPSGPETTGDDPEELVEQSLVSAADADASGRRVVDVAQEANRRSEAQADKSKHG